MAKRVAASHQTVADIVAGCFDEDGSYRTWRPQGTGDWLIIATVSGLGRLRRPRCDDMLARPGDLLLSSPHTYHDYGTDRAAGRWQLLWAHFQPRPHWHAWLDWPAVWPGLMKLTIEDETTLALIVAALREMHEAVAGYLPRRRQFALNALERALLWCDHLNPQSGQAPLDPRIARAVNHLCANFTQKTTIGALAKIASLSPSRFSHLFVEQVGLTPIQFIERQRIDRARQLLEETAHPIQQIAARVGYDSPFYFSLRFSRPVGQSPRQYRQSAAAGR
jgi:AraC family transcriptional regulator of arabinose operon